MELYEDEKWKFSKKSRNNGGGSCRRAPAAAGAGAGGDPFLLKRSSSSVRDDVVVVDRHAIGRRGSVDCAAAPRPPSSSFSSRCAGLVKEQRARFYIMRRCVTMLVCWKD